MAKSDSHDNKGYRNGCRCDVCRADRARYRTSLRKRHAAELAANPSLLPHGVVNTYQEYGCRCDECRTAHCEYRRILRAPSRKEREYPHGTSHGYDQGCRCDECRSAHAVKWRESTQRRAARIKEDPSLRPHGIVNTYRNWGCRCEPCVAAGNASKRKKRKGNPERRYLGVPTTRNDAHRYVEPFGREWLNEDSSVRG